MPPIVFGCDLSRASLDIHALPEDARYRIENTPSAVAASVAYLDPACLVVVEATSGCDGPLIDALSGQGIAFARVNPRQAREFARATGILAKTDRVDARVLAEMGRRLRLEVTPSPDPDRGGSLTSCAAAGSLSRRARPRKSAPQRWAAGDPARHREHDRAARPQDREARPTDRSDHREDSGARRESPVARTRPGDRPHRARHAAWRIGRTRHDLPKADCLPRRPRPACPRERHMARRPAELGRPTQGPRDPLHRGPDRHPAHPEQ